jgi:hypothetical protein
VRGQVSKLSSTHILSSDSFLLILDKSIQTTNNTIFQYIFVRMEDLSERYQAYARDRGESSDLLQMKIQEFQLGLKQSNFQHEEGEVLPDKDIIRFLRARNMNVDFAVKTFINWKTFRRDHPTWFHELHAKEFGRLLYHSMLL